MKRLQWHHAVLALAFLAQLALLIGLIAGAERTIEGGRTWKFRTAPVDPVDLFRGRYVTLNFPTGSAPLDPGSEGLTDGDRVYVRLDDDEEGFARFAGASATPPATPDYLALEAMEVGSGRVRVRLPYDRFYMEESRAPEVERLMLARTRTAWAEVRVHQGQGVVMDLRLEDEPGGFDAAALRLWPETTPLPESLVTRMRDEMGMGLLRNCRDTEPCLLAAVDLDDAVDEEWIFTTSRPLRLGLLFYATRSVDGGTAAGHASARPEDWSIQAMRLARGPMPRTVDEVVAALERDGARGEVPPRRWLRLDAALLEPTG